MSKQTSITAHYVARSIDLAKITETIPFVLETKTRDHYVFKIEKDKWVFLHSFGVVVLVNLPPDFLKKFITKKAQKFCTNLLPDRYSEEYTIIEDATLERDLVEFEAVTVKELTMPKIEIIEEILAQSVGIDASDHEVEAMIQEFSRYTTILEEQGQLVAPTAVIMKGIGKNYGILESALTRLSLLDRPEILWEEKELENLFISLRSMFELEDRFSALDSKLKLIQSHSSLFLDVLAARRTEKLELIIIVLILVEIVLFAYELFGK